MDEKSRYYDLLVSTVSNSDFFNSLSKNIRQELLNYMHSQSYKEDFDNAWEKLQGLESFLTEAFSSSPPNIISVPITKVA